MRKGGWVRRAANACRGEGRQVVLCEASGRSLPRRLQRQPWQHTRSAGGCPEQPDCSGGNAASLTNGDANRGGDGKGHAHGCRSHGGQSRVHSRTADGKAFEQLQWRAGERGSSAGVCRLAVRPLGFRVFAAGPHRQQQGACCSRRHGGPRSAACPAPGAASARPAGWRMPRLRSPPASPRSSGNGR